jgi:hypothetical protein
MWVGQPYQGKFQEKQLAYLSSSEQHGWQLAVKINSLRRIVTQADCGLQWGQFY